MGATEMSLTALNFPQLLMCSFSRRKKFHTNLRKTSRTEVTEVRRSPSRPADRVRALEMAHENLEKKIQIDNY